ncbi:MAG: hypothetical protein ACRCYY_10320 [Trueperaceae bacterium]
MMRAVQQGLSGQTGNLTGEDILKMARQLQWSGTLVLSSGLLATSREADTHGMMFILLDQGQERQRQKLGRIDTMADSLGFHIYQHSVYSNAINSVPLLPSRFPQSALALMRVIPVLGVSSLVMPKQLDLKSLLESLQNEGFTGYLSLGKTIEQGLVLLHQGHIAAAVYENDGYVREGSDALRLLRRASLFGVAELELVKLEPFLVRSLLGLALSVVSKDIKGDGLESGELGYTFVQAGQPLLRVAIELHGRVGFYEAVTHIPDLVMPDEPIGWEQQRYQLTLRGRDALNPMTSLSMEFQSGYGKQGKRLLEQLSKGLNAEKLSESLIMTISDLKPMIEKLEREGLIRHVNSLQ